MLTRLVALVALATVGTAQAQIYEMQILLQGDVVERFGAPSWTDPAGLSTFLYLDYDTRLTAPPSAPGSMARTYASNGPHNRWTLDIGSHQLTGLIPTLQVSDTAMSMHFADAATQTMLEVNLVFRSAPPPGRLLPMFDWGPQPGSNPDFTDQNLPPLNPAAPFISSFRFSTQSGYGLDPGGFRAEVYEGRYLMEQYAEPPPVFGAVPEPAVFGLCGTALLGLMVVVRCRPRSS